MKKKIISNTGKLPTKLKRQNSSINKKVVRDIGILSVKVKGLLRKNIGELNAISGNLLGVTKGKEVKSILVTSSKPGEGKTLVSIGMAYGLSESNANVLLVDGNLRRPFIHALFRVNHSPGLTDMINSGLGYDEVFKKTEFERLTVVPCGNKVYQTANIFKSKKFKESLDLWKEDFDYVIFDGHSILISSDISLAAKHFDGIIVVIESEKTKWEVVQQAKEKIDNIGGNIIGVVLNKRKFHIPRMFY